jgi:hypothetical protein
VASRDPYFTALLVNLAAVLFIILFRVLLHK